MWLHRQFHTVKGQKRGLPWIIFNFKCLMHKSGLKYTHLSSHHPCSRGPGYRSMALIHPTVPWQQTLEDVPHDHDYWNPKARAHQYSSHYLLGVCGQIPTVDRDKDASDRNECHTSAVAHTLIMYKEKTQVKSCIYKEHYRWFQTFLQTENWKVHYAKYSGPTFVEVSFASPLGHVSTSFTHLETEFFCPFFFAKQIKQSQTDLFEWI